MGWMNDIEKMINIVEQKEGSHVDELYFDDDVLFEEKQAEIKQKKAKKKIEEKNSSKKHLKFLDEAIRRLDV